jgi:hypothetical protein
MTETAIFFTCTPPFAFAERKTFTAQLLTIINTNRAAYYEAGVLQSSVSVNKQPSAIVLRPTTPRTVFTLTPINFFSCQVHLTISYHWHAQFTTQFGFSIRKRVLSKMPELAALHRELFASGQNYRDWKFGIDERCIRSARSTNVLSGTWDLA